MGLAPLAFGFFRTYYFLSLSYRGLYCLLGLYLLAPENQNEVGPRKAWK